MTEKPDKPGRGRPKTLNKAMVIDVARTAYWEKGPTEVSLNEVCVRAGVSKPSLYREFRNDDGLAHAVLENYAETVLGKMLAIIESDDTLVGKIRGIAHLTAEDQLHDDGCLFVKMRAVKTQMGPKTRALIEQIDTMSLEAFTGLLEQGQASGEWSGGIQPELGGRYLHAQVGLALDQRARGLDPKPVLDLALSVLTPL